MINFILFVGLMGIVHTEPRQTPEQVCSTYQDYNTEEWEACAQQEKERQKSSKNVLFQ